jgi:hypothetical protein
MFMLSDLPAVRTVIDTMFPTSPMMFRGGDGRGLEETPDALHECEQPHGEQHRRLSRRGEDLGALEPPRPFRRRRPRHEGRRQEGHEQAAGVGEHVGGVDQERQAPRDDRADDLDDQDRAGDAEGDRESAAVARAVRCRVVVPCTHVTALRGGA